MASENTSWTLQVMTERERRGEESKGVTDAISLLYYIGECSTFLASPPSVCIVPVTNI